MTLVEWLRQPNKLAFDPELHARMNEAAAEIERLRAARKEAIRKITTRLMSERSGMKPTLTLDQWEAFIEECLNEQGTRTP